MFIDALAPAFADERGTITDLVENDHYAVTVVKSQAGSIRGNHVHKETEQWTYVLSGKLLVSTPQASVEVDAGRLVFNPRGEAHAWRALEDTVCIVWVHGPRAGSNYESDTYRLDEPLIAA